MGVEIVVNNFKLQTDQIFKELNHIPDQYYKIIHNTNKIAKKILFSITFHTPAPPRPSRLLAPLNPLDITPVMKVQRLEERRKNSIRALLARREIALVDYTDLDHHPRTHVGHTDYATKNTADEVNHKQVGRVPRPQNGVA